MFHLLGLKFYALCCYFFFYQHYYQYKRSLSIWSEEQEFPWQIEHLVRDTIAAVRPKLQMYTNLEEAQKAVTHLNSQIVAKAIEVSTRLKYLLVSSCVKLVSVKVCYFDIYANSDYQICHMLQHLIRRIIHLVYVIL